MKHILLASIGSLLASGVASAVSFDVAPFVSESNYTVSDSTFSKFSTLDAKVRSYGAQVGLTAEKQLHKNMFIGGRMSAGMNVSDETIFESGSDKVSIKTGLQLSAQVMPRVQLSPKFSAYGSLGYAMQSISYNDADYASSQDVKLHGFTFGGGLKFNVTSSVDMGLGYQYFKPRAGQISDTQDAISHNSHHLSATIAYTIA